MTLVNAELLALPASIVLGLLTLKLAQRACVTPGRFGPLTTAAVLPLVGLATVGAAASGRVAVALPVIVLGTAAALVDVHEQRLPNALTGALTATTTVVIVLASLWLGNAAHGIDAGIAALVTALVLTILKLAHPPGLGWGDVKLLPALSAVLAWPDPANLYRGVLTWTLLLLLTIAAWPWLRVKARETVPYGPALVAGALGALLVVT